MGVWIRKAGAILAAAALLPGPVQAQHSIEVQRLTARGEYFNALAVYEKMPKRKAGVQAVIAAGKH